MRRAQRAGLVTFYVGANGGFWVWVGHASPGDNEYGEQWAMINMTWQEFIDKAYATMDAVEIGIRVQRGF